MFVCFAKRDNRIPFTGLLFPLFGFFSTMMNLKLFSLVKTRHALWRDIHVALEIFQYKVSRKLHTEADESSASVSVALPS
jgi:hypothetical protein